MPGGTVNEVEVVSGGRPGEVQVGTDDVTVNPSSIRVAQLDKQPSNDSSTPSTPALLGVLHSKFRSLKGNAMAIGSRSFRAQPELSAADSYEDEEMAGPDLPDANTVGKRGQPLLKLSRPDAPAAYGSLRFPGEQMREPAKWCAMAPNSSIDDVIRCVLASLGQSTASLRAACAHAL